MDLPLLFQNFKFPMIEFVDFSVLILSFSTIVALYLTWMVSKVIYRNFKKTLWQEKCLLVRKTSEKNIPCVDNKNFIENISLDKDIHTEKLIGLALTSRLSLLKLQTPGLVAILISNDMASIIEVNCNTEATAQSEYLCNTVDLIAHGYLEYGKSFTERTMPVHKVCYDFTHNEDIKYGGKSVNDYLDLLSETTGERVVLRRAMTCRTHNKNIHFYGYTYPHLSANNTLLGRIGSVIAVQSYEKSNKVIEDLGLKLSQHIVAMAPLSIDADADILLGKSLSAQKFLHNDKITVSDLLNQNKLTVIDICRYECGEMDLSLEEIMRTRRK